MQSAVLSIALIAIKDGVDQVAAQLPWAPEIAAHVTTVSPDVASSTNLARPHQPGGHLECRRSHNYSADEANWLMRWRVRPGPVTSTVLSFGRDRFDARDGAPLRPALTRRCTRLTSRHRLGPLSTV